MKTFLTLAAAAALTLAAGCTHPGQMAATFGDSVEAMHRAQTIPTDPKQDPPVGSGATGAAAQQRYQSGSTAPLMSSTTTSINSSSQ